ncbi:MAG: hypothetical protein H6622_08470 [Halobacteriovoraceae bacterium]|nr:hypothetical protein [Halobacteriovoraceae bacterium]
MSLKLKGIPSKLPIRIISVLFVFLCANVLKDFGEPRPAYVNYLNGLISSIALISGPFLASFYAVRNRVKFVLMIWIFISLLGVTFLLIDYGVIPGLLSVLFHIWVFIQLLQGKKNEVATNN